MVLPSVVCHAFWVLPCRHLTIPVRQEFPFARLICSVLLTIITTPMITTSAVYCLAASIWFALYFAMLDGFVKTHNITSLNKKRSTFLPTLNILGPPVGLEPTIDCLQGSCPSIGLRRHNKQPHHITIPVRQRITPSLLHQYPKHKLGTSESTGPLSNPPWVTSGFYALIAGSLHPRCAAGQYAEIPVKTNLPISIIPQYSNLCIS